MQPIANVKGKVIIYPDPSCLDNPKYVLYMHLHNPNVCKEVSVLLFPDDGDTFEVMGTHNDTWYSLLCKVDIQIRTLKVQWYQKTRGQGI